MRSFYLIVIEGFITINSKLYTYWEIINSYEESLVSMKSKYYFFHTISHDQFNQLELNDCMKQKEEEKELLGMDFD